MNSVIDYAKIVYNGTKSGRYFLPEYRYCLVSMLLEKKYLPTLERFVNIKILNLSYEPLLIIAAMHDEIEVFEYLVKCGLNMNHQIDMVDYFTYVDQYDLTVLKCQIINPRSIQLKMHHHDFITPLAAAILHRSPRVMNYLLDNSRIELADNLALKMSCYSDNMELFKLLINKGYGSMHESEIMIYLIENERLEYIKYVLDIDVYKTTLCDKKVLEEICSSDNFDFFVNYGIDFGTEINYYLQCCFFSTKNLKIMLGLGVDIVGDSAYILNMVLSLHGRDLNQQRKKEIIELLIEKGIDIHVNQNEYFYKICKYVDDDIIVDIMNKSNTQLDYTKIFQLCCNTIKDKSIMYIIHNQPEFVQNYGQLITNLLDSRIDRSIVQKCVECALDSGAPIIIDSVNRRSLSIEDVMPILNHISNFERKRLFQNKSMTKR